MLGGASNGCVFDHSPFVDLELLVSYTIQKEGSLVLSVLAWLQLSC